MLLYSLIAVASVTLSASPRYADCVTLVEADLEIGRIAAQQWVSEGGGAEARHCLADADLKAGFPKLAAVRLQEIAERDDAGDDYMRARVLDQAAQAWLLADQPKYAKEALDKAFALVPDSGELQLTAAKIYGAQEKWQDVIEAVKAAEDAEFVSAETFVLRGRARYIFGAYERAADDVVAALSLEPTNLDALVLRGDLAQVGINIDVYFEPPAR
ncbi:tetratricopeptide repeat protein [Hyphococcus sp. DH-69]|uniref:tetratricopeptide repeat protein n=1 Tax=Hyphococcus formosus TaxID=3143534 RepID=UPI00398A6FC9